METLYPITHHFYPILEECGEEQLKSFVNHFGNEEGPSQGKLIYIHIPFCESKCIFCPFHTHVKKVSEYKEYVSNLIKEIEMVGSRLQMKEIKAIYFGGGSPSVVPPYLIDKIFKMLERNFNFAKNIEITFEGEPRSLANDELIEVLYKNNVTRISFGVQTFNLELRKILNVNTSIEIILECIKKLRKKGFSEINIDMLYNLPGQTIEMLKYDLNKIIELDIDSVDYYYLSYYSFPKSYFIKETKGLIPKRPTIDMRKNLLQELHSFFKGTDYSHSLSTLYSKKRHIPQFYKLLWGGGNGNGNACTIALGVSARGYINGRSYANYVALKDYYKYISENKLPISDISKVVSEENRGMVFFPNFLKIDFDKVPIKYMDKINELINLGLVINDGNKFTITDKGVMYMQNIPMMFFEEHQANLSDKIVDKLESNYENKVTIYG